jgi:hypothetical protein
LLHVVLFLGVLCEAAGAKGGQPSCPRRAHNPAMVIVGYNLHTVFTLRQRYKNILNTQAVRQGKMLEGGVGAACPHSESTTKRSG